MQCFLVNSLETLKVTKRFGIFEALTLVFISTPASQSKIKNKLDPKENHFFAWVYDADVFLK